MIKSPQKIQPKQFTDAQEALDSISAIYAEQTEYLRAAFVALSEGQEFNERIQGFYPYARISTKYARRADSRLSYGFAPKPGSYSTTLTRPDIFDHYYRKQFELIFKNHDVPIEIGVSDTPIPLHFALGPDFHLEKDLEAEQLASIGDLFDVPDLDLMDDEIANSRYDQSTATDNPLALFTAPRVDISIQRLRHYCGMDADHFQNFVIFTNYQFYIDEFVKLGEKLVAENGDEYSGFVQPDPNGRTPQMPAYHLQRPNGDGITMVNIGVGPSNAKTITDHIAVLRPHAWLMLGHCAGLRSSQSLGDYVLAHGYLREDNILDKFLPTDIPIPALAEIQIALQSAVAEVTGEEGYDLKKVMRTGTVATTDDRNWELGAAIYQNQRLSQSRAIAMDMESGTIAANGFRFRVAYGTLLCVSDKPLHGQLKLPGMADSFYRERVNQHLKIGLLTMEILRKLPSEKLHSRKLRSFNEVAFQ